MEKRLREKLTASQLSDKKLFTQSINRIRNRRSDDVVDRDRMGRNRGRA
jgi:hypothetical protein